MALSRRSGTRLQPQLVPRLRFVAITMALLGVATSVVVAGIAVANFRRGRWRLRVGCAASEHVLTVDGVNRGQRPVGVVGYGFLLEHDLHSRVLNRWPLLRWAEVWPPAPHGSSLRKAGDVPPPDFRGPLEAPVPEWPAVLSDQSTPLVLRASIGQLMNFTEDPKAVRPVLHLSTGLAKLGPRTVLSHQPHRYPIQPGSFISYTSHVIFNSQYPSGQPATAIAEVRATDEDKITVEWRDRADLPTVLPEHLFFASALRCVDREGLPIVVPVNNGLSGRDQRSGWAAHSTSPADLVQYRARDLLAEELSLFTEEIGRLAKANPA